MLVLEGTSKTKIGKGNHERRSIIRVRGSGILPLICSSLYDVVQVSVTIVAFLIGGYYFYFWQVYGVKTLHDNM